MENTELIKKFREEIDELHMRILFLEKVNHNKLLIVQLKKMLYDIYTFCDEKCDSNNKDVKELSNLCRLFDGKLNVYLKENTIKQ